MVQTFKYLGVPLSCDPAWSINTRAMAKKGHQRLYFLRCLRKTKLQPQLQTTFAGVPLSPSSPTASPLGTLAAPWTIIKPYNASSLQARNSTEQSSRHWRRSTDLAAARSPRAYARIQPILDTASSLSCHLAGDTEHYILTSVG